jgi:hypothetical protein
VALSDFIGKSKLYLSTYETVDHSLVACVGNEYVIVPVTTLKSLLRKIGVKHVELVKVDAEGSELRIIKGAGQFPIRHYVIEASHYPSEVENSKKASYPSIIHVFRTFKIIKGSTTYIIANRNI